MRQNFRTGTEPRPAAGDKPLPQLIAEAVQSRTTPLSQLLRLMSALDAQDGDDTLRVQLRTRIGAPLSH